MQTAPSSRPACAAPIIPPPDALILAHQRSGTHLLQSLLSSHPDIETRGEFILHYKRSRAAGIEHPELIIDEKAPYRYRRRDGAVNLGIVMYSDVAALEDLCARLDDCRILHLVRDPVQIAHSVAQMQLDREVMGANYRAHYHLSDLVELPPIAQQDVGAMAQAIGAIQSRYVEHLAQREDVLTVSYEELTSERQVNVLDEGLAGKLLGFLGLEIRPLSTRLIKSSLRGTGVNGLSVPLQ